MTTYPLVGGPYAGRLITSDMRQYLMPAPRRARDLLFDYKAAMNASPAAFDKIELETYTLDRLVLVWTNGRFDLEYYRHDSMAKPEADMAAMAMFLASAWGYLANKPH